MSAVDELIARLRQDSTDAKSVKTGEPVILLSVAEAIVRSAFDPGGPCLTREQVVEVCEREMCRIAALENYAEGDQRVAGKYDGVEAIRDAFRSGEEPR